MNESAPLRQTEGLRLGVDIGGTKLEAAIFDLGGRLRVRRRTPTPANYETFIRAVSDLVAACEAEAEAARPAAVGVCHPGSLSPITGCIRNANSTWLNGRALDADLEAALGRPIRLANDADCFALSEAVDGAGAGAEIVFGVILGTGVGGGVVIGERLLDGAQRIAGEWGHNPLPWPRPDELPGPACWCGKRGCIETWLSGPGMADVFARGSGRRLDPPALVEAARRGDADAAAALADYADRLARGLATVVNVVDPHVIVLGGGMSNIENIYDATAKRLPRHVFSDHVATRIERARHGDSSGVRGAAWLWRPEEIRAAPATG